MVTRMESLNMIASRMILWENHEGPMHPQKVSDFYNRLKETLVIMLDLFKEDLQDIVEEEALTNPNYIGSVPQRTEVSPMTEIKMSCRGFNEIVRFTPETVKTFDGLYGKTIYYGRTKTKAPFFALQVK